MRFAALVLRASALAFFGIGAAFLVAPASMAGFVGISSGGASADNDIRAVYGGLQLACGALLWTASRRIEWLRPDATRSPDPTRCVAGCSESRR